MMELLVRFVDDPGLRAASERTGAAAGLAESKQLGGVARCRSEGVIYARGTEEPRPEFGRKHSHTPT